MSAAFRVHITGFRNSKGQFASLTKSLPGGLHEVHERVGPQIVTKIQQETPVASGTLQAGWAFDVQNNGDESTLNIANNVGYLDAVLKGRSPGWMEAKNSPFMVFEWQGDLHFRKIVFHPGTAPNDFLKGIDGEYVRFVGPEMVYMAEILLKRHLTNG